MRGCFLFDFKNESSQSEIDSVNSYKNSILKSQNAIFDAQKDKKTSM